MRRWTVNTLDNSTMMKFGLSARLLNLPNSTCVTRPAILYLVDIQYYGVVLVQVLSIRLQELQTAPVSPDLLAQQGLSWSKLPGNRHPLLKQASWK